MAKRSSKDHEPQRARPGTTAPGATALDEDDFLSGLREERGGRRIGPVRIEGRISKGGMGIVYRGHHLKLDIDVAVKFLLPHLARQNPEYVLRFEREARIAAHLNNENLVRVFDVDSDANYHYVVMELVCGETAKDRVARKGRLSESEAMEIILGATRGLEAAHRKGIVHRDIKPENIMIDASGLVKLADLGIAKMVGGTDHGDASLTQPGFVMGTPSYMPPEQLTDPGSVGFSGDVYSMGATLYYLLTGSPPFPGNVYEVFQAVSQGPFPDIRAVRPDVSRRVAAILRTATERVPGERYPDATALLRALETSGTARLGLKDPGTGTVTAVAKVSTPPARRVGEIRIEVPPDQATPPARRHSHRGALVIAAMILFGIAFAGGLYYWVDAIARRGQRGDSTAPVAQAPAAPQPGEIATARPVPASSRVLLDESPAPPPPPPAAPAPEAVKAAEPLDPARRRYLLERARELIALDDIGTAATIFDNVKDWTGLESEAAQIRIKLLLESRPPREEEAMRLVAELCAGPGAGAAGSACEIAYRECLDHAGPVPREGAPAATFHGKLEYLRRLGTPRPELPELAAAYDALRHASRGGYLRALSAAARAALAEYRLAEAREALDRAAGFLRQEKLEAAFAAEASRLAADRVTLGSLEKETAAWSALRPLIPVASEEITKLPETDLRARVERFAAFAREYPRNPNSKAAEEYRGRYQRELEERK